MAISVPRFDPGELEFRPIRKFQFQRSLEDELQRGRVQEKDVRMMFDVMLLTRAFEEMIVELKGRRYEPVPGFVYTGPTHVSIGQEGVAAGAVSVLEVSDYITSTHRGHGHSIAKGYFAIQEMDEASLRRYLKVQLGNNSIGSATWGKSILSEVGKTGTESVEELAREDLQQVALRLHFFKTIAELFGKEDGYCRGRGGSMHIADFHVGHLGANAIVAGSSAIATGAAIAAQELGEERVCVCFLGDGAINNGIFLESLNFATMRQFKQGTPVIFLVENNHYGMTGRTMDEVTDLDYLARRAAGFASDNLHAEVVNGMDALAVRDALERAREVCLAGQGPVFLECVTYRYFGHSLSDDGTRYRSREEIELWQREDPIVRLHRHMVEAGLVGEETLAERQQWANELVRARAIEAAQAPNPNPEQIYEGLFVPASVQVGVGKVTLPSEVGLLGPSQAAIDPNHQPDWASREYRADKMRSYRRNQRGEILYRHAVAEAIVEEMIRDRRVVLYGEDVARYGGAFQATHGIYDVFGAERVFDTPISEACIVGVAAGMSMAGLRPIAEIMYIDFILQTLDQLANQVCKTRYMFGGKASLPLVLRTTIGGGKGYAGQHSQSLESIIAHFPGIKIAAPATAYDAKGLLKSAIRDDNPVFFIEHQRLYTERGVVPEEEYVVPFGEGIVRREGSDVTLIAYSWMVSIALQAADLLAEYGITAEVVDPRTLYPFDVDTIAESVRKTRRAVVMTQSPLTASFAQHIAFIVHSRVFDRLLSPVDIISAHEVPPPMSPVLEQENLPSAQKVTGRVLRLLGKGAEAERYREVPPAGLMGRVPYEF